MILVTGLLAFLCLAAQAQVSDYSKSLAPYVPSPPEVVEKMLEAAKVTDGDVVYDLGSGDGRVLITAAKKFKARSVGVEIEPKLVERATARIQEEGLGDRCRVIQGNALEVDLSEADVVVLYLLTSSNELLRPNLERSLKDGARVVSHDFEVRGWNPVKVVKAEAHGRSHNIFVYEMPTSK
ncbi:MAG: class I SAM-dependent methyltransferase [bacterium]|nr:class I SAM-dependent methyltransferase [bacterium]